MGGYGGPAATVGDTGFEEGSTGAALEKWAKDMEKAGKQVEASAEQNAGAPSAAAVGALIGAAVLSAQMKWKAKREENFLSKELGRAAYAEYSARTPMLVPFVPVRKSS